MQPRRGLGLYVVLLVVFAGVAVGCAGTRSQAPATSQAFAAAEAKAVFKSAYRAIADRFIQPVSTESVAAVALVGLSDIDASVAVGRVGDAMNLSVGGKQVTSMPAPKARDVDGWAELTVRVWRAARAESPRLAAASDEDVYEAVLDRAMQALGSSSHYATALEARRNRQRRDGYNGVGIGVRIEEGEPTIVEITGRSPAERAGLRVGDVLLYIDGRSVAGLSAEEINERLHDDVTGWVRLSVRRAGRGPLRFAVLRSYLIPDTIRESYDNGILYLAVSHFNQGTADTIEGTVEELSHSLTGRLRGIVLDLRGDPGGLLQQSVKVADLFLDRGQILATRGRHPDSIQDYVAGGGDIAAHLPLVILVDGDSASAAEIVAAVLQDRERAVVVGSSSHGKGTIQTVVPLPNGGELSITWSQAVPPSGGVLSGKGVRPVVCTSGLYVADPDAIDRVLRRATGPGEETDVGCPAERREIAVDLEIARRLINDDRLYASLLRREPLVAEVPVQAAP
jgi:carboxyl-terminal processing protease